MAKFNVSKENVQDTYLPENSVASIDQSRQTISIDLNRKENDVSRWRGGFLCKNKCILLMPFFLF